MATTGNATPLISLDAWVIDSETTGLDPGKARIVEIGAVPLRKGKLDRAAALRLLVNPGEPIPPVATTIHKIDDAMVADAPSFAAAWPDIAARISGSILIGHTLGFDLAVIQRDANAPVSPGRRRARSTPICWRRWPSRASAATRSSISRIGSRSSRRGVTPRLATPF